MNLAKLLRKIAKSTWLRALVLLVSALLILTILLRSTSSSEEISALFIYEIAPLLETKCLACHGKDPNDLEGGLDLSTRQGMLRGGNSGKSVVSPGSAEDSYLLHAIRRIDPETAMPPKSKERLSAEEIDLFVNWIEGGAPWPDDEEREEIIKDPRYKGKGRVSLPMAGALSEEWADRKYRLHDLWAYRPLKKENVPSDQHPIDYFISRLLNKASLTPTGPASAVQLVRRVYFDLTGLPPTYKQLRAYLENNDSNRYSNLLDSLLETNSYGEQMARHWLDIVRYADSDGFSNDYLRPNAWRYRDYIIRSFNDDKPFDQFVLEQIAGDELDPLDPEMLISTGFLRMGPWEHTAMSVAKETRQLFLDDVVNSVGETFLSTPLMCAKCHDHKFDPISSYDYYQIQACFATTQFADRPASFLEVENRYRMENEKERIEEWINRTLEEQRIIENKEELAAKSWYQKRGLSYLSKKERRTIAENQKPPRYLGLNHADLGYRKVLQKRLQTLNAERRKFEPLAFSVYNGHDILVRSGTLMKVTVDDTSSLAKTHVLRGGSVYAPMEEVNPGILQAIPLLDKVERAADLSELDATIPNGKEGRRLALARWITNPANPLTSRSIVNRIWQMHFGQGLALDPNNFGTSNETPLHTALIDYLSAFLIENNWSLKALHRLIMSSGVYQRSTDPAKLEEQKLKDPSNKLFAHFNPRRLAAEELRDALLFISGEINLEMGGIPARPEINQEVALQPRHIMGSIAQAYQPDRQQQSRNRRTIYTERIRSLQNPFLSVFNQPPTELSCGRRSVSTISPQALALFNNDQIRNRALATAARICAKSQDPEVRIKMVFQDIFLRDADPDEIEKSENYVRKMIQFHQSHEVPEIERPVSVKRKMFEEMTGEAFEFEEKLDINEDYEADLQYYQVSEQIRALADLCLVMFNSNEFVYVY